MAQLPYPITVEGHRDNQPMFVRLISEADDGFTPKHVIVQPQSNIDTWKPARQSPGMRMPTRSLSA
jgi:hypothetical protein